MKKHIEKQKGKIKILNQKLRRKGKRITNLSDRLNDLREKNLLSIDASQKLENTFSGLDYSIISSHHQNMNRAPVGRRYHDEVKRFALTLHFYSPRAYDYLRNVFSLPHTSSLYNWTLSVKCDVGFFKDVFLELKKKIYEDPLHADCNLVCDGMSIKSSTI